jgi:hypothetical protein
MVCEMESESEDDGMKEAYLFYLALKSVPAIVRLWFTHDLDRKLFSTVEKFVSFFFFFFLFSCLVSLMIVVCFSILFHLIIICLLLFVLDLQRNI